MRQEIATTIGGRTRDAEYAGVSVAGRFRSHNEDALDAIEGAQVFVVAHGSSGLCSGVARVALDRLRRHFDSPPGKADDAPLPDPLAAGVLSANLAFVENDELARHAGCTLAALRLGAGYDTLVHAGDCRIYRRREGRAFELLTIVRDLPSELLRCGLPAEAEEARELYPDLVTRVLGGERELALDLQYLGARPGDLYLLCSGGFRLPHDETSRIVAETARPLAERCLRLIEAADGSATTGLGNLSVLLVQRAV